MNMALLSLVIPGMQMMRGLILMAESMMGVTSLFSLQEGSNVVLEVLVDIKPDPHMVLTTASTVGWRGTGTVTALLVTGQIGAMAVERGVIY